MPAVGATASSIEDQFTLYSNRNAEISSAGTLDLNKDEPFDSYIVMPVPPEILDVYVVEGHQGWNFFVKAKFNRQKRIKDLLFEPLDFRVENTAKREVAVFFAKARDGGGSTFVSRIDMTCASNCDGEESLWTAETSSRLLNILNRFDASVNYFVAVSDEYGNIATELPAIFNGPDSDITGYDYEASMFNWNYFLTKGYSTLPFSEDSELTVVDATDSLLTKADILGFRAAASRTSIYYEVAFAADPNPFFTRDDNNI